MMKENITIAFLVLFSITLHSRTSAAYEAERFEQALARAKAASQPVLIEIQNTKTIPSDRSYLGAEFFVFKVSSLDRDYESIVRRYELHESHRFVFVNGDGQLLAPIRDVSSEKELEELAVYALKHRDEQKPLPQRDFDYKHGNMDNRSVFDYIAQRTTAELDNADIIDEYSTKTSTRDILSPRTLSLLFEKNTINVPGKFYTIVAANSDKVKKTLKLSDKEYNNLINKSMEQCFEKLCLSRNEAALEQFVGTKTSSANPQIVEIIRNEYYTRFYYKTGQPLKLANFASAYADAIINHKDTGRQPEQERSSYASSSGGAFDKEICALKLRDAAQYVVETLSNKTMLNNALTWSMLAVEMFDCPMNYETQAYVLYKLGKKNEAIDSMAKACARMSGKNVSELENVGLRLIKMKRGERIF